MVREGVAAGAIAGNVAALLSALGFATFTITLRWGKLANMLPAVVLGGLFSVVAGALVAGYQGANLAIPAIEIAISAGMGAITLAGGMVLYTIGSRVIPAAQATSRPDPTSLLQGFLGALQPHFDGQADAAEAREQPGQVTPPVDRRLRIGVVERAGDLRSAPQQPVAQDLAQRHVLERDVDPVAECGVADDEPVLLSACGDPHLERVQAEAPLAMEAELAMKPEWRPISFTRPMPLRRCLRGTHFLWSSEAPTSVLVSCWIRT